MSKSKNKKQYDRFIKTLRLVRESAGVRQIDLAQKLDRPQSFVSKYESGERRIDVIELNEICDALGISLIDFVSSFQGGTNES
jgi:transcriptional regulator with XRE-family HTH domain